MMIREEQVGDIVPIADVIAAAFTDAEQGHPSEPLIVGRLREAGALTLSLVGTEGAEIVGHIAFSPVTIGGAEVGWFGLGPVSVRPQHQGKGIGGELIRRGLEKLRLQGAAGCVVVGAPAYYQRFGFEKDSELQYKGVPPEFFMRLKFGQSIAAGEVDYHPAFGVD